MTHSRQPWPQDLREQVRTLVAAGMSSREVAAAMGITRPSINRAVLKYGLGPWQSTSGPKGMPIPADLADVLSRMTLVEAGAHYGISAARVHAWKVAAGITAARPRAVVADPAKPPKPRRGRRGNAYLTGAVDRPMMDCSAAGQAAEYLRRFGPVVRCDAAGRYDARGTHWRRGSTVLTADEIMDRARRNGWNPYAWKLVA